MKTFIVTCGDINGIGPEIVIKSLNRIVKNSNDRFVFICPENVFTAQVKKIKLSFDYNIINSVIQLAEDRVCILSIGNYPQKLGSPTKISGRVSLLAIEIACNLSMQVKNSAIITAPISKFAWSLAGVNFPGHTEMFSHLANTKNYIMMFLSKKLNAALLTIHQPISRVSNLITKKLLERKFDLIIQSMRIDFRKPLPKLALLGLNPHAGESGLFGKEEKNVFIPFIQSYKHKEFIDGPFSSDGFFGTHKYLHYDLVVGAYHDQVLNPFKLLNFNKGVNFTAGLPFVRTSPDHGTAFDIAGLGNADESSFIEAYRYSKVILDNRIFYARHTNK